MLLTVPLHNPNGGQNHLHPGLCQKIMKKSKLQEKYLLWLFTDLCTMNHYSAVICRQTDSHPDLLSQLETDGRTDGHSLGCAVMTGITMPSDGKDINLHFHLKQIVFDDVSDPLVTRNLSRRAVIVASEMIHWLQRVNIMRIRYANFVIDGWLHRRLSQWNYSGFLSKLLDGSTGTSVTCEQNFTRINRKPQITGMEEGALEIWHGCHWWRWTIAHEMLA